MARAATAIEKLAEDCLTAGSGWTGAGAPSPPSAVAKFPRTIGRELTSCLAERDRLQQVRHLLSPLLATDRLGLSVAASA